MMPAPPTTPAITYAPSYANSEAWTARSAAATTRLAASGATGSSDHTSRWRPPTIAANGTADVAAR